MPDVAIPTRPGQQQDPLRFALRALSNVTNFNPDTDRVWLIGELPSWAVNVEYIPGNRRGSKGPNILDNWLIFCEHADCDEFLAFNDDIYALQPTSVVADEWREPLAGQVTREPNGWWRRSLQATLDYCRTLTPEPLSFELHRPALMNRERLAEALDKAASWTTGEPPQWRSVYGNHWNTGAVQVADVKVKHPSSVTLDEPWISTNPGSWNGTIGQEVRRMYAEPSKYEQTNARIPA